MNPVDPTLYGILDPMRTRGRPLDALAREAAIGGASLLQLRDKTGVTRRMVGTARAIREALSGSGVPLLVNDRVDVALAARADGVHLGQDDLAPGDARDILGPNAIVGLTVKTIEDARDAPLDQVDYVCIGGVFNTMSKENPASIGLEGFKVLAGLVRARSPTMPVAAIAGIDAANAGSVIRAGADGVAIISALFMAEDVEGAARALRARIEGARRGEAA